MKKGVSAGKVREKRPTCGGVAGLRLGLGAGGGGGGLAAGAVVAGGVGGHLLGFVVHVIGIFLVLVASDRQQRGDGED